ncbi:MAG TPA: serine hydrolase domain-containing protein, partial [Gammaproteobacteria bacterium]
SGLIDHVFDVESGFQSYLKQKLSPENIGQAFDPEEFVSFVLDRKPLFPAGTDFHYSDTGYILAGIIIEKVSGASYYHEINRRFIKPLGLIHTSALNERDAAGVAQGYATKGQQLFGFPAKILHKGSFVFDPSLEWTGGGLISTSKDLVHWAKALYGGTVIDVHYLNEMLSSVANPEKGQDDSGRKYGYGLGVSIAKTEYGTVLRHGGFFPGYNSLLAFYPDHGIAVAMQINTDDSKIEEHFEAILKIIIKATNE